MKNLICLIFVISLLLAALGGCGEPAESGDLSTAGGSVSESKSEENSSNAESCPDNMTYEDFLDAAYKLGYSSPNLDWILDEGYSYEKILDVESFEHDGLYEAFTSDGKYKLSGFYYNEYRTSYVTACIYVKNLLTDQITIFDEVYSEFSSYGLLDDSRMFIFFPYVGGLSENSTIRFYSLSEPKTPYSVWEPMNGKRDSEYIYLCDYYVDYEGERVYAFWADTPGRNSAISDKDSNFTYRITALSFDGTVIDEYDTGVPLVRSRYGGFESIIVTNRDSCSESREIILEVGEYQYNFSF